MPLLLSAVWLGLGLIVDQQHFSKLLILIVDGATHTLISSGLGTRP